MKAAADAWGSRTNLFAQGLAKETRDPAIVTATMARPGVVLRRPVGSNGPFTEHAQLPKDLPGGKLKERQEKPRAKTKEPPASNKKSVRAAALAFEREQKQRDAVRRKEIALHQKERQRREQAIAKAERALEQAKLEHETKLKEIESARVTLDRKAQAEGARWEKHKEKLQNALRKARD